MPKSHGRASRYTGVEAVPTIERNLEGLGGDVLARGTRAVDAKGKDDGPVAIEQLGKR